MSNLIVRILCPNYEDDDVVVSAMSAVKAWPLLWPEEAAAECAIYDERMRWLQNLNNRRGKPVKRSRVHRVLAQLAAENGWKLNDAALQVGLFVYHIAPSEEVEWWKPKPRPKPTKGIAIDGDELRKVMGDLMPFGVCTRYRERQFNDPAMDALISLADEQGWKTNKPDNGRKIYKIR